MSVFVYSSFIWIAVFVCHDFFTRGFLKAELRVVKGISRYLISTVNVQSKVINADPNIFAPKLGFGLTLMVILSVITGNNLLADLFASILFLFSFF